MKVHELKEKLSQYPDEADIVMGLKITINGNERNMGTDHIEVGGDSNEKVVWLDMKQKLFIDSVAHVHLKRE